MILAETIFVSSKPVGVVRLDTLTRQIAFSPIKDRSRLPDRSWDSMDQLKLAIASAYSETTHDEGHDN